MDMADYLTYLEIRGRKETTLETYRHGINACERCLREHGISTDPQTITEDTFYFLQTALKMRESSKVVRLRSYAAYIEWATGFNPLKKARLLWNEITYNPCFISVDEYGELLQAAEANPPLYMCLLLGGMMGLRRGEIAAIRLEDLQGERILIHGKGHGPEGKVAYQYIPQDLQREIRFYLAWRKQRLAADHETNPYFIIFLEKYGHAKNPKNRTQSISRLFELLAERTGVNVAPHALRRLYATQLYNDGHGADIETIARLMRHSNPAVTWRYIRQNDRRHEQAADSLAQMLLNRSDAMRKHSQPGTVFY